jgi:hypothetical protein
MIPKSRTLQKIALRVSCALFFLISNLFHPISSFAQGPTYTIPQSVSAVLATNLACTGSGQSFSTNTAALNAAGFRNLGQTQHYVTITPAGTTALSVRIFGQDANGNNIQISDAVFPGVTFSASNVVTGSGNFPNLVVIVQCTGGSFTLTYFGTSATSNVTAGSYLVSQQTKSLFTAAPTNTTVGSPTFVAPYASSFGKLFFQYQTAGIAGSSLTVACQSGGSLVQFGNWTFPLVNTTAAQIFQVPDEECPLIQMSYVSGGASANTFNLDYGFTYPGRNGASTSAVTLSATQNLGAALTEKGARWFVRINPSAGVQASASKAAGTNGVTHVADCVTFSAGSTTAPALTSLTMNLRDGASAAGTLIWSQEIVIPAATGQNVAPFSFCGLNLIGSANTAMTLEFSAGLANLIETVTLTGYDVQ